MTTTDTLGYVVVSGKKYFVFLNGGTDGSDTEIKLYDDGGTARSLGEALEGNVLQEVALQSTDGSILTTFAIYDPQGAKLHSFVGNERTARDLLWNLRIKGIHVRIERGTIMKVNTGD